MSVFGNYASAEVVDAAEKFISKMDEHDLAAAVEQSERTMSPPSRALLVEAIFDAFRQRGESSEDAAEAAGTTLDAIARDESAVQALLRYANSNPGLLKEAAIVLVERHPDIVSQLAPAIADGIARRLLER
jgi:hypothetical protein